jgi:multiple sugar transport system permease protein
MAKRSRARKVLPTVLIHLGLAVGLVFACFPILWMFFTSLKSNTEIFALPPRLLPKQFTIGAYLSIFNDPTKLRFFFNSYLVAGAVAVLTVLIAILAAYSFSRFSFRFKNMLNVFIISTQTVPPITLLIPYFGMVVMFGIFDTYFALILTYMVFTLPYAILLLTGYLNTLPRELDEAVLVDGGTTWSALWRVIVPLSVPGIVATVVYTFLLAWNEFLFALTLTKSMSMRTVPIGIELLMGQHAFEWNEMMAMSVLGSLPLLILYLFAQRYFLAGMTAGAIKA